MTRALPPPEWTRDAACAEIGTEPFYPNPGDPATEAKAICARCPVTRQCLDAADSWGIWGGLTVLERRRLRREEAAS